MKPYDVNRFKPYTVQEVMEIINAPRSWGWCRKVGKQIGRSAKSVAYVNTCYNRYKEGNREYPGPSLVKLFDIATNKTMSEYKVEAIMLPPTQAIAQAKTSKEIADAIERQIAEIEALFLKLGDAIVKEQYHAVNKELQARQARIEELEAQIKEMEQKGKFDIKSYFNIK